MGWVWEPGHAEKTMQTGLPDLTDAPVGLSVPVERSTASVTMESLSSLSANMKRPSGERVKNRGVLPCVGSASMNFSAPVDGSMLNTAMLS